MTTREEQIEYARPKDLSYRCTDIHCCASKVWAEAIEWADANPQTTGEIVIEAIKNIGQDARSYLLLKSTEAKLAIAVDYLEQIQRNKWVSGSIEMIGSEDTLKHKAYEALAKIKDMK